MRRNTLCIDAGRSNLDGALVGSDFDRDGHMVASLNKRMMP